MADELGIDIGQVEVSWGDTELIGEGFGTYGSRTLTLAGNAALLAARKLKDRLRRVGAALMGVNYEDVVYENGYVRDVKTGKSLSIKDIANALTTNVGGTWPYGLNHHLRTPLTSV